LRSRLGALLSFIEGIMPYMQLLPSDPHTIITSNPCAIITERSLHNYYRAIPFCVIIRAIPAQLLPSNPTQLLRAIPVQLLLSDPCAITTERSLSV